MLKANPGRAPKIVTTKMHWCTHQPHAGKTFASESVYPTYALHKEACACNGGNNRPSPFVKSDPAESMKVFYIYYLQQINIYILEHTYVEHLVLQTSHTRWDMCHELGELAKHETGTTVLTRGVMTQKGAKRYT